MGGNYLPEFKDKIPVLIVSILAFCICGAFWDDRIYDFLLFFLIHKSVILGRLTVSIPPY